MSDSSSSFCVFKSKTGGQLLFIVVSNRFLEKAKTAPEGDYSLEFSFPVQDAYDILKAEVLKRDNEKTV